MKTLRTARMFSAVISLLLLAACGDDPVNPGGGATRLAEADGDGQSGLVSAPLASPLRVLASDASGNPVGGVTVDWSVVSGGGSITPSSVTDGNGIASATFTLGPSAGQQESRASVEELAGSPVTFSATGSTTPPPPPPDEAFAVLAGGNNVPERFSSDLWVHGDFAYTGTWGSRNGTPGNALKVWQLSASGAPTLTSSVTVSGVGTVSDVEVTSDGQILLLTAENGPNDGLYLYSLANPAAPAFVSSALVSTGLHTGTFATIAGRRYVFAAKNPSGAALMIYDVTDPANISVAAEVPVAEDYGIHDTFVRDGIAFVFAWNTGVILYDVGNGMAGGTPTLPVEISRLVTSDNGVPGGPQVHNGWWFHNPVSGEERYLFIGQEGPSSSIGGAASGDIHVVDVSNLNAPVEVAFYAIPGAGAHNFWMDEAKQILYAAYYNGGVVALDVSGTLSGNLASREIARIRPGGAGNTFVWGVQLYEGSLYAIDMLSGLWQLDVSGF